MNTGVNNPGQRLVGKKTINTTWQHWTRQLLYIHTHREYVRTDMKYYNRANFMHAHIYACVQTYAYINIFIIIIHRVGILPADFFLVDIHTYREYCRLITFSHTFTFIKGID